MKTTLFAVAVSVSLILCNKAIASPSFTPGNHPQIDEENVLFDQNDTGNPIWGTTNQSHLTVGFDSTTDLLLAPSNGQARVIANDGSVNDISVWVPGGYYTDLIINPFLERDNPGGPATVTVVADDGTFTYDYVGGLGNGNNFLTIVAGNNEHILKTIVDSAYGFDSLDGFGDLRQPRISGAALDTPNPPSTPEPCTLGLLGLGGIPLAIRRKKVT